MVNQSLQRWTPALLVLFASMFFIAWAVDQEAHIQGSVFLPGGFPFHAYFPGRYAIYCDMDIRPENEYKRANNMRALPRVITEVTGAGYLNVLNINSWHSGGLSRYIKSSDDSTRLLIPFAEFDILWPGNYEVRATFIGQGPTTFLISLGPTSLVATSLFISIVVLVAVLFFTLRKQKTKKVTALDNDTRTNVSKENYEIVSSDLPRLED